MAVEGDGVEQRAGEARLLVPREAVLRVQHSRRPNRLGEILGDNGTEEVGGHGDDEGAAGEVEEDLLVLRRLGMGSVRVPDSRLGFGLDDAAGGDADDDLFVGRGDAHVFTRLAGFQLLGELVSGGGCEAVLEVHDPDHEARPEGPLWLDAEGGYAVAEDGIDQVGRQGEEEAGLGQRLEWLLGQ